MLLLKSLVRQVLGKQQSQEQKVLNRLEYILRDVPRFTEGDITVLNWNVRYVDAPAFISSFETLIVKGLNDFYSSNPKPLILDCGANIGISVLRYKQLFPNAEIIAFEPDKRIHEVINQNLKQNKIENVTVIEAAVWTQDGEHTFFTEGADGSRLTQDESSDVSSQYKVKTIDLSDYIRDQKVDFIKLDIEGAEFDVMEKIAPFLHHVEKMLIEIHHNVKNVKQTAKILNILEDAGFSVSINLLGPIIILQKPFTPNEDATSDQYLLVCAWREH
jgi:FkbM family methyltransferase